MGTAGIAGTRVGGQRSKRLSLDYEASSVCANGILNNISQLWNTNQFLGMMSPGKSSCHPNWSSIEDSSGSIESFNKQFFAAAGAGHLVLAGGWLVKDAGRAGLKITKLKNGCKPFVLWAQTGFAGVARLGEHSYFTSISAQAPVYLTNFLDNLVNWENVARACESNRRRRCLRANMI
ncbi:UNVERIFIED_CONTAM: hypothetical protein GTU68_057801 [Idotea baltica]|nr:hypothetical protein [Idotea baltica]